MSADDRPLRGIIGAADVAIDEGEWATAEDALTEALGEVRKRKGGSNDRRG